MAVGCGVWDDGSQGYMMPQHGGIISVNTIALELPRAFLLLLRVNEFPTL